jgi:hypothetical protein
MFMFTILRLFSVMMLLLSLAACLATTPKLGDSDAKTPVTGAAGGANATNVNSQLQRCDQPLGTVGVIEDTSADWYRVLTTQYQLPAVTPLIRLMIQQSNCFVVVDRGRGLDAATTERQLQKSGELRANSSFGKGQMVSADYSMTPTITFAQNTGGAGISALLGAFSSSLQALSAGLTKNEASTTLLLVDNRSSVQVAAAEGSASNMDFFGMLGSANSDGAVSAGAYSRSPKGKAIAGAFMDSYNQMVIAVRDYKAQSSGNKTGLGTGGALKVDGQSTPGSRAK